MSHIYIYIYIYIYTKVLCVDTDQKEVTAPHMTLTKGFQLIKGKKTLIMSSTVDVYFATGFGQ